MVLNVVMMSASDRVERVPLLTFAKTENAYVNLSVMDGNVVVMVVVDSVEVVPSPMHVRLRPVNVVCLCV